MSGWTARLTDQAAQDIENILDWTYEQFGPLQMEKDTKMEKGHPLTAHETVRELDAADFAAASKAVAEMLGNG